MRARGLVPSSPVMQPVSRPGSRSVAKTSSRRRSMRVASCRRRGRRGLAGAAGLTLVCLLGGIAPADGAEVSELFARLQTAAGDITVVFFPELAPHHVDNFVHLARTGFFDGTAFHRAAPGFVIQGGDPNSTDGDPDNDGMGAPTVADVLMPAEQEMLAQINAALGDRGYEPVGGHVVKRL